MSMGNESRQNVKWVEGVRGLASFFVVVTHLCRAWDYELWFPRAGDENAAPRLLQLPFLRVPWQGRIGVTMFAFLTGFVCAIKPLRQVKSGNLNGALATLGKSAFRRPPRFILPSTFALVLAWFIAQLHGFKVSLRTDSQWLRASSPEIGDIWTEIPRLFHNFQTVWINGRQEYDDHQWALLPLLQGAFTIYVTLFATVFMKNRCRIFTVFVLFSWYWLSPFPEKETFECQFLWGVLLCDIRDDPIFRNFVTNHPKIRRALQIIFITLGIYVAGFPGEHPEWAGWSRQLIYVGDYIFPPGTTNYAKRWSAVGWDLCALGIVLSPTLQDLFSNRIFMWLGRNSFAVYLTHGTLLRVVLCRMIYGWSGEPWVVDKDEEGNPVYHWLERGGTFTFMISIPVWFALLYTSAHLWTTYIDNACARITLWLEKTMFEEEDEKNSMQLA
ncbi:acyltransferase family-domain-containing protein [Lophiotrema nucula]|uniref:Acyltransferase family-domain-containing protein n=1 Tax=Lophiotrema nucula TaxID=690887 RepID=A0A6A5YYF3_9PLEO|nr:acyltransferase family-domain-containing protein [Lophiotrema nucula]